MQNQPPHCIMPKQALTKQHPIAMFSHRSQSFYFKNYIYMNGMSLTGACSVSPVS
jgi:hypothetical protein